MISKVHTAIPYGYDGFLVDIESDINKGLPKFNIVGMADKIINESRERVRSAIVNSSLTFPNKKLTVSLAPADLQKDGSCLDLPIAISILVSSSQLLQKDVDNKIFAGELALDGKLRPIRGIISIVEAAKLAKYTEIYIPEENVPQASLVKGIKIIGVNNLMQLFLHLKKESEIFSTVHVVKNTITDTDSPIFDHIRGQKTAKRALEVAIAGHHNILISGPPGAGKTLLAKAAANLLPDLSSEEQISLTKIYSIANTTTEVITKRPFRSPHHTASLTSIVGGGTNAKPGEISLAHHGVLFLDEIPEFQKNVLESLRQPMEDKKISISRANRKTFYPSDFMLIATMNPCPCGYAGDPTHTCTCTMNQINNYNKKLSGPLFDRIDIYIPVQKVDNDALLKNLKNTSEEHERLKREIEKATKIQYDRYKKNDFYNSSLSSHQVSTLLHLSDSAKILLKTASDKLNLSARSYFKVIKVAQTISDLESNDSIITNNHIAEAISFRKR